MYRLRAAFLLAGFVLGTLLMIPVQYVAIRFSPSMARAIPRLYHRVLCAWLGVRVTTIGQPVRKSGVLYLSNHTSYFDILAISTAAEVSFIAKREVAAWPFFGLLAQLQRTVFVDREKRSRTGVSRDEMAHRLASGDNLVLFPEGTSNDGNRVLPFKSALIGVVQTATATTNAHDAPPLSAAMQGQQTVMVQPLSVVYRRVHGVAMGRQYRPHFAWYGDMELVDHLFGALTLGPVDVEIIFHDPIPADLAHNRKAVAALCQRVIGQGVAEALSSARHRPLRQSLQGHGAPAAIPAGAASSGVTADGNPNAGDQKFGPAALSGGENPAPAF
jgi:1-acyl-sn-glycerol-3-phosphate acyltransferase